MAEHIVEMMDVVCYGGTIQQIPNANKIREEIVRCCDCADCTEEGIYTPQYYCHNRRWHYLGWQGTPTEPDGFCKWGKRKKQ